MRASRWEHIILPVSSILTLSVLVETRKLTKSERASPKGMMLPRPWPLTPKYLYVFRSKSENEVWCLWIKPIWVIVLKLSIDWTSQYDLDLWLFDPKIYRCVPLSSICMCMKVCVDSKLSHCVTSVVRICQYALDLFTLKSIESAIDCPTSVYEASRL